MTLLPCHRCASPTPPGLLACPHCNASLSADPLAAEVRVLPLILLSMGLSLGGCGDKEEDTAEDTGSVQALYGVAETGDDGSDDT